MSKPNIKFYTPGDGSSWEAVPFPVGAGSGNKVFNNVLYKTRYLILMDANGAFTVKVCTLSKVCLVIMLQFTLPCTVVLQH